MRSFLLLSLSFLVYTSCSFPVNRRNATILFPQQEHDFGTIFFKKPALCHFQFTNPGPSTLVIDNVRTTCGCTVADWTKKPVKPGKSGIINIRYDATSPGVFIKEIGVYYNGAASPVILKIKGKVAYPDE